METTAELTDIEMREILKDIARTSQNQAARIAAIKELRAMDRGEDANPSVFEGLYEVGKAPKSKRAA